MVGSITQHVYPPKTSKSQNNPLHHSYPPLAQVNYQVLAWGQEWHGHWHHLSEPNHHPDGVVVQWPGAGAANAELGMNGSLHRCSATLHDLNISGEWEQLHGFQLSARIEQHWNERRGQVSSTKARPWMTEEREHGQVLSVC